MGTMVDDKDRGTPCPRCKKISIKLISLTDDGKGKLMCRNCKRKFKKRFPKKDYRFAQKEGVKEQNDRKE